MNKTEFLDGLKSRLSSLPPKEIEERLCFYAEMIEDRIEDGLSEDDAVLSIGTVEDIADEILAQSNSDKKEMHKGKIKAWHIVLLIAGSPIWGSLLIPRSLTAHLSARLLPPLSLRPPAREKRFFFGTPCAAAVL